MTIFKNYVYDKDDVKFTISASGVSKTNVQRFIATIPKRHFKGLHTLYFLKLSKKEMYGIVKRNHHPGETDFNRDYHAMCYEDENGFMKIKVYISDDFYRELNKTKLWVDMIRGAILHELGHYHIHKHELDNEFNEIDNEHLVDRFVERNSNIRLLMLVNYKKIRKFDKIWDRIEKT